MCVFRVSSRENSPRFSTWLGQTTAFLMTPLISWILWLWYGPNGLDRTNQWWFTAGTVLSLKWWQMVVFLCFSMNSFQLLIFYGLFFLSSAGIGRTGVLITMETALCLMECGQPVYPLDIVRTMRDQRAMMIQTPVCRCFNMHIQLLPNVLIL